LERVVVMVMVRIPPCLLIYDERRGSTRAAWLRRVRRMPASERARHRWMGSDVGPQPSDVTRAVYPV
jgi:hypothetical protein